MAFSHLVGGTATVLSPTATTYQALGVAYSMKWVDRLQKLGDECFFKFTTPHPMPLHMGEEMVVEKSSALAVATTPLDDLALSVSTGTELDPNEADWTLSNIVLKPRFYGNDMGWTLRQELTYQDVLVEKRSNELAINSVETFATLVANEIDGLGSVNSWTSLSFARVVTVGRVFRTNSVRGFDELGGNWVSAIGPYGWEDLLTEGSPKYADNFQTRDGSNQIASGQLEKPFLGFQFFVTNYNKSAASLEYLYFWGYDAIATTELNAGVVGMRGRQIAASERMPSLRGYIIPAEPNSADHYGLKNWAVWRGGPWDVGLTTATQGDRIYTSSISYA